jgi:hypothetical protein
VKNAALNEILIIDQAQAKDSKPVPGAAPNKTILTDVTRQSGLNFQHKENKFIDFKMQRLLYYQLSRLGGKLSKGDVNDDGNDDVFFGGATGQAGSLFLGTDDGKFTLSSSQPWQQDASSEDINSLFFDVDNDGDADLYVVSGGSEFVGGAPLYQDRLYLNDGKGNFTKATDALPLETASGSCAIAADFDKDGDLDLFVGSRHVPANYAVVPSSFILQNNSTTDGVRFANVTSQVNGDLSNVGMVTAAAWTDFNNDSWPDLIVVGEWMPIRIFQNEKGKLIELKDISDLQKSNGWWCSITSADIDDDGDQDYLLGNAGTNLQFKASVNEPVQLHAGDFNDDGIIDPILSYYIKGKSYPLASRDELLDQVASLRKKFIKYEDFASASIQEIATAEQIEKSYKFTASVLQSCWLENIEGEDFKLRFLPSEAQFSSINAFVHEDFDLDGKKEIIAAGNFYPFRPQLGRSDASMGVVINYNGSQLEVRDQERSGLWLTGDIRDMAILRFKGVGKRIIVSRNNDAASVYSPARQ